MARLAPAAVTYWRQSAGGFRYRPVVDVPPELPLVPVVPPEVPLVPVVPPEVPVPLEDVPVEPAPVELVVPVPLVPLVPVPLPLDIEPDEPVPEDSAFPRVASRLHPTRPRDNARNASAVEPRRLT